MGGGVGVSAIYRISAPESLSSSVSCLETLSPISFYLVSGYSSTSLRDSVVDKYNQRD